MVRETTTYLSSHSHGSMEHGCISNSSYLSNTAIFHWTMIMGERVANKNWSCFRPLTTTKSPTIDLFFGGGWPTHLRAPFYLVGGWTNPSEKY